MLAPEDNAEATITLKPKGSRPTLEPETHSQEEEYQSEEDEDGEELHHCDEPQQLSGRLEAMVLQTQKYRTKACGMHGMKGKFISMPGETMHLKSPRGR